MPLELDPTSAVGLEITLAVSNTVARTGPTHNALGRGVRLNTAFDSSLNWYWEFYIEGGAKQMGVGVDKTAVPIADWYTVATGYMYYAYNGYKYNTGAGSGYGSGYSAGAIIGCQLREGKLYFYVNGVIQNSGNPVAGTGFAYSGLTGNFYPAIWMYQINQKVRIITQEGALTYPLPTGASALESGGSPMFTGFLVPTLLLKKDVFAGLGTITGTLKINGVAAEGYVTISHRRSGYPIQTVWAAGGNYQFTGLDPSQEYDVIARDPNRAYKDYIEPAVVPAT